MHWCAAFAIRTGRLTAEKTHARPGRHGSVPSPPEILAMARHAGFKRASHVSAAMLNERYFAVRTDDLRTSSGEKLLVAVT